MNYEKLTVERFAARLKEDAYQGLTGARRAIGKTDWSKKDRERAHVLANDHFGDSPKPAAKAAPKKAVAKKAAAPKKAASAKPPKKAAAAKAPPAPKTQAAAKRSPVSRVDTFVPDRVGSVVPPGPPILEEVTRQNSASAVISAYRNSGPLNTLEQRAYDVATAEYAENASKAARRIMSTAARGIPTPAPLDKSDEDEGFVASPLGLVQAPLGAPARISVNGVGADEPELTAEEQAQYDRLQKGAAAVPAILGQGGSTS